ncbi:fumarylacetoacetate hydrolase family protein [Nannocystis sp. SCPEA4]|uniref:fumarylacetoacetate hydrolase family protein n=1 Tax=Nannocystis sp. SCPEA4 TaxID=2996787 RepID=UPI00226EF28C|nr:fumarylacetoacetate hydrolase family protein [Nannocystis sp. SCPEA4]MCY1062001.1 fumarylacetoacetate hydrolase family protein [Nannocystis sp. SCPEA4]
MTSAGNDEVLWLGRARAPGAAGARAVRVRTRGAAPGPGDIAEEIDDPFADDDGDPWQRAVDARPGDLRARVAELELLAPVRPSKVICVGRNFRAHAAELGNEVPSEPLLFFKPPSCLVPSGQVVHLPRGYERIDMESELVLVVGRKASHVSAERAFEHVAGYAVGNDVSNRDLQKRDKQWTRAKGFDGFGPLGAFVRLTPPGFVPPAEARICGWLNGQVKQSAPLADMVFDVPYLFAYISACMTLMPGDLIFTGTPEGVAALQPGDSARVALDGLELAPLVTPFA